MEDMNIEVVEKAMESVQEVLPAPVSENAGMTLPKVAGVAAGVYGLFEGGKWLIGKICKGIEKHRAKKAAKNEDAPETDHANDKEKK